jgi:phenylalanyl-tRNA synthetase alpha chain
MTLSANEFYERLTAFENEVGDALNAASSLDQLEAARARLLGRNSPRLREIQAAIPLLPDVDRGEAGARFNRFKAQAELWLEEHRAAFRHAGPKSRSKDLTMPARHPWRGAKHPVTLVIEEVDAIFRSLGFTVATGPEIESEWYNFGALNFPSDHPAMDMHDTLYLGADLLLRTHTSPVQARTLERHQPPIRVLIPGNVYRRDFFDASHAPAFAQIEGLAVDEGVSFVDLKATLSHFADRFFGGTRTRFRPSYFPFTEPSAEMDVECQICHGRGCATCKQTGWAEMLGCGMVHPAVLDAAGVDSERYTGWAFGMGPARMAQQRFAIPDIRTLYDSDVRFLEQFAT